jgi:predicted secreted protein
MTLAFVPGHVQHCPVVLGCEVRSYKTYCRKVHRSLLKHGQKHRKPPDEPGGLDASVSAVLREMEHLRAIGEERGAAFREVQAPLLKLREVSNQRRGRLPLAFGQGFHPLEQFMI